MNNYQQIFSQLPEIKPQTALFSQIKQKIKKEEYRKLRWSLILFSFSLVGSLAALVPSFQMMRTGIVESGFMQFLSLLFSDTAIVANYWQNFLFTLLETLPIISLVAFLAAIFVFLESIKFLAQDLKVILTPIKN